MKRNKALIKKLLTFLEDESEGTGLLRHELKTSLEHDELGRHLDGQQVSDAVDYHLHLLKTAGFLVMFESEDEYEESEDGSEEIYIEGHPDNDEIMMTWTGHDYLEGQV